MKKGTGVTSQGRSRTKKTQKTRKELSLQVPPHTDGVLLEQTQEMNTDSCLVSPVYRHLLTPLQERRSVSHRGCTV